MGLGDVFVNPIARFEGTLVAETDLPSGSFHIPSFIPKIEGPSDLQVILDGRFLHKPPELICYEVTSVRHLTEKRALKADQKTISGSSTDPDFDTLRRTTFSMTDPLTEFFTYKKRWPGRSQTGYLRQRIAELRDFPAAIRRLIADEDSPWGDEFWREVLDETNQYHVALIDWYARHQSTASPSIFLPPVNVVEGNRSLDFALQINEAAAEAFPAGEDTMVPALYLILHPKVFKSEAFMERLKKEISARIGTYRILALKFLFPRNVLESAPKRKELKNLLSHLNELKKVLADSCVILAIDLGEPGLALLAHGFDAYAEPLSGFLWFPQARGRTREDRARETADLDIDDRGTYWIHPIVRVPLRQTQDAVAQVCHCAAHDSHAASLSVTSLKRIHNYNVRTKEIGSGVDALGNGDFEYYHRVLGKGQNRNLLDLLPSNGNGI